MTDTRQIAVILDSARAYHRKILLGIGHYVTEVGNWSLYLEDQPAEKLPDLEHWQCDGILLAFVDRKVIRTVCRLGIPIVGIEAEAGWYDPASRIPYYSTDNRAIGQLGANHLIDQGFSRLAFCGYPASRRTMWSIERGQAFATRARRQGFPCSLYTGRYIVARHWSDLQRHLAAWLESLEKPVGLMAANDTRARHVLEACKTIGARVPEDIAVLGVDNDEVVCELTNPPLSSVEQAARSLGYHAAAWLNRLMAGSRPRGVRRLVAPQGVVMRRSTSILAVADVDVATALAYIRQHACDPVLVGDVVAAVQISRSALETRFRAVMRRTIHAEIQRVQVEQVRRLIATTELPLKQIASMAGFSRVNYMTTVFHEHTGWTPADYRKHSQL